MKLPNLSNSMYVARLRHIQSIHEEHDRRNPDTLVRHFLPRLDRWRSAYVGDRELNRLRTDPFYYYLLARTRYYDQVVADAVKLGSRYIVSVGCGSDTRAHRFASLLKGGRVQVVECDQPDAIRVKARISQRWPHSTHITYLPIDLNDGVWPALNSWLEARGHQKALVMMEGVSPYINSDAFERFLSFLAWRLPAASSIFYDFKIQGINDQFGRERRTIRPFRLPNSYPLVLAFHEALGFRLTHFESSAELTARLVPAASESNIAFFNEDDLVQLEIPA